MSKEKYIEEKFNEWKEYYDIPFNKEFDVKALLGLQYDFNALPDEHIKAKKDLIDTMQLIQRNLNLVPKKKLGKKDKEILLIVTRDKDDIRNIISFFKEVIAENEIISLIASPRSAEIETTSKIIKIKHKDKSELFRGIRCHSYWNLTGDLKFENEVLKPMVIR